MYSHHSKARLDDGIGIGAGGSATAQLQLVSIALWNNETWFCLRKAYAAINHGAEVAPGCPVCSECTYDVLRTGVKPNE